MKVRYCDDPPPSNGGKLCTGDAMILETCNAGSCPGANGTAGGSNSYGANYASVSLNFYKYSSVKQYKFIQLRYFQTCFLLR